MKKFEINEKRFINLVIQVCGLLTFFIGVSALLGWILDIPQLASIASGKIPMALSSAVLFVAFGFIIFFHNRIFPNRTMFRVGVIISSAGILVALLFLYLSMNGIRLDIEHFGLKLSSPVDGLVVGHMSPVTAFCFVLVGFSYLITLTKSGQKRLIKTSLMFAVLVFLISIIFLASYFLGTPLLYDGSFIPPALTTSLALLFLGIALLLISGFKVWSYEDLSNALSIRYTYILISVFILLILIIITVGYSYYKSYERQFRSGIEEQLSAIAELKVHQIEQWRKERFDDANIFYKNKAFSNLVAQYFQNKNDLDVKTHIKSWITKLQQSLEADQVTLIDPHFNKQIIFPEDEELNKSFINKDTELKLRSGEIVFEDFYFNEKHKKIYLKVFVPILDEKQGIKLIGILSLRIDPQQYLYPLLKEWPAPTKTAETLLIRREGNDVVFLNEQRFQKDSALNLRKRQLTDKSLPAARAVLGKKEFIEGVDYRGVPVIAYVCPVPNSPWFMITRVAISEVYAPLREWFWAVIILVVGLLIGSGTSIGLVWRQQRSKFYTERYRSTENIRRLNRIYLILHNINEAIVRIRKPQELFEKVCDIAVETGEFQMSWIGKTNLQTMKVDVVAFKGAAEEYLNKIDFNCEGDESLLGIAGRVVKTGIHVISNDIQNDESILSLHKESVTYGSKSFAAFPLIVSGQVWGVFKLYSQEIGFFDVDEIKLLDELAMDISFALEFKEKEDERKSAAKAMINSETRYRRLFESAKDGILILDAETGKIIDVNPFLIELLGYSKEQLIEKAIWEIGFFKDIAANEDKFFELQQKEYVRYEDLPLETSDGRKINVEFVSNIYLVDHRRVVQCNIQDITERKKSELKVQQSEERYRQVIQNASDIIFTTDINGNILFGNNASLSVTGYTHEEFIKMNYMKLTLPEIRRKIQIFYMRQFKNKIPTTYLEYPIKNKSGKTIWLGQNANLILEDDHVKGFHLLARDITDRKQTEEKLLKSEEKYRSIFENIQDVYYEISIDGTILEISPSIEISSKGGYHRDDLIGKSMYDSYSFTGGRQAILALLQKQGSVTDFEIILKNRDGSKVPCSISAKLQFDANRKPLKIIGSVRDITDRKHAEESLQKQKEEFETIFNLVPAQIWYKDTHNFHIRVNRKVCNDLGMTKEQIEGHSAEELFPSFAEQYFKDDLEVINTGKPKLGITEKMNMAGGEIRWIITDKVPVFGNDGIVNGLIAVVQDITDRKHAEEALVYARNLLKALMDKTPDLIYFKDLESRFIRISITLANRFGLSNPAEAVGKTDFDFYTEEHARPAYDNEMEIIKTGIPVLDLEEKETWPDGKMTWVSTTKVPFRDDKGEIIGTFGISRDITERKHSEQELIKAKEKAEESGKLKTEFLAQMSHEIRSPMNAILSFSNIIKEEIQEKLTPEYLNYFNGIETAGQRLIRTVDLILNTSEMQVGTYEPTFKEFDLIGEVIKSVKDDYIKQIEDKGLKIDLVSNVPEVIIIGDKYSVRQIFVNLMDNAVKYTKNGSIIIQVEKYKEEMKVSIEDTGIGMSEEFMNRMYMLFNQEDRGYTRKFEGNGLGLSLVKKYCDLNGIRIEVESKKGIGTKFTLTFKIVK